MSLRGGVGKRRIVIETSIPPEAISYPAKQPEIASLALATLRVPGGLLVVFPTRSVWATPSQ